MRARASARSRGPAALAAIFLAAACAGEADDEGATAADPTATTGDDDAVPVPRILEPAAPQIDITADRREPLVFRIDGVIPGRTRVIVDDRTLGVLAGEGPIGSLTADTLTLAVHGALLFGPHVLVLENPTGAELGQRSREVTINILPAPPRVWSAAVDEPVIAAGAAMIVDGEGDDAVLTIVDAPPGEAASARIFRASAGAWAGAPQVIDLAGYVDDPAAWTPRVAALLRPGAAEGAEDRLRIAWAVDLPAATIVAGEGPWGAAGSIVAAPVVSAPGPIADPLEWSAFDRLRLTDEALLIEVIARVDAELPRPGDRRLLAARWPDDAAAPTQVVTVEAAARIDLDSLGQALVADGGPERRSLRVAGRSAGLLEFTAAGAPLITLGVPTAALPTAPGARIELATVSGAFLSRSVFAADPVRGPSLSLLDGRGFVGAVLTPAIPLAVPPAGPPSLAVLDGWPVALLPLGDAAPLHLLSSDGALLRDRPLGGVHCDRVALVPALAEGSLGFACLRGGEVRFGTLSAM